MELDDDQPLNREDVERIAYQAIGHQFRLPALFSVVLMVVGFVLGHYVASRHVREVTDRLEARLTALSQSLETVEKSVAARPVAQVTDHSQAASVVLVEPGEVEEPATLSAIDELANPFLDEPLTGLPMIHLSSVQPFDDPLFAAGAVDPDGDAEAVRRMTSATAERLREEAKQDKEECLAELTPYVEKRMTIDATNVVEVVESIFAGNDRRLASLVTTNGNPLEPQAPAAPADDAGEPAFRTEEDRTSKMFPPMETTMAVPAGAVKQVTEVTTAPAPLQPLATYRFFPKPRSNRPIFFAPSTTRRERSAIAESSK